MRPLIQTLNAGISDKREAYELSRILGDIYNRLRSVALTTAGLVINGAANAAARTGASITYVIAEGKPLSIAANTVLPAFTGTVANNTVCPYVFTVDKTGTTYIQKGTAGATLASAVFPELDPSRAILGVVIIAPTSGTFTGGTSALDGTAANAVYISPVGVWDPSAIV